MEVERSLAGKSHRVLSQQMTQQMLTRGMGDWGLGIEIGGSKDDPYFTHGGVNEGFQNDFAAYEKNGEGAAVMTSSDNGMQVADEILRSIAAEYNWPDWHPTVRTAIQVDEKTLATYVGTYMLAPNFDIAVTVENGKLAAQATGQGKFVLYAATENKFFAEFPAEVEFVKDDRGR